MPSLQLINFIMFSAAAGPTTLRHHLATDPSCTNIQIIFELEENCRVSHHHHHCRARSHDVFADRHGPFAPSARDFGTMYNSRALNFFFCVLGCALGL